MNKLLVITVLVAVLAFSAESLRMPRQVEEEKGPVTKFSEGIKSYYDSAVNTAKGYLDSVKGMKVEEKLINAYSQVYDIVGTYAGILNDQIYHRIYPNSH